MLRRRKNPKHFDDRFILSMTNALINASMFNASATAVYYKQGEWCKDCDDAYALCECDRCENCGYNICFCDINIEKYSEIRKTIVNWMFNNLSKNELEEIRIKLIKSMVNPKKYKNISLNEYVDILNEEYGD